MIVNRGHREPNGPSRECLFNAGRKRQLRIQLGAIKLAAVIERQQHDRSTNRREPPHSAVKNRCCVTILGMNDRDSLIRRLCEYLERHLLLIGIESLVCAPRSEAGQTSQSLAATNSLDVFIENLRRRRL